MKPLKEIFKKLAMVISMIIVIYIANYTAKYSASALLSTRLSSDVWQLGSSSSRLVPDTPHSYRFYSSRGTSPTVFGRSASVTLRPHTSNATALFDSIPNPLKKPIYWECSPTRYLGAYLFVLITVILYKRFLQGTRGGGVLLKKTVVVLSCMHIAWMGMVYPAMRLFWSGMQEALKHKYISDTRELDSTRLLWMSSEIHNALYVGILGAMVWLTLLLSTKGEGVRSPELKSNKLKRMRFIRNVIGVGVVLFCIMAPVSMPLTIGLII